ncbi:MAG: radical SAM protein, partial [Gammaproteobacteria bacterium]
MIINWRSIRARLGKLRARFKHRHHNYNAWLHFGIADACNLRCSYCISDSPGFPAPKKTGGKIAEIRIDALMHSLEQSGRIYRIVFAGSGEPFLIPNFIDAICALTGKHLVGIHTNLTLKKPVFDLITRVRPERVLKIHASAHLEELERTGRMDCFVSCFHGLQKNGFPVTAEAV